ncbi:MAG: hypothetical protein K6T83_01375 [Alicyclobacillus sp.]|nr:hypothetical protein [Alicyclobacillus sp.]
MGKIDVDTLNQVLEHLTDAHHKVQAAVPLLAKYGSLSLLEGQIVDMRERLCDLTEIAAALMDAKLPREE